MRTVTHEPRVKLAPNQKQLNEPIAEAPKGHRPNLSNSNLNQPIAEGPKGALPIAEAPKGHKPGLKNNAAGRPRLSR